MRVYATRCEREDNVLYEMDKLRIQLMKIRVCGIDSVSRAIIVAKSDGEKSEEEKRSSTPCQQLLIEGTALQAVMGIEGIKGTDAKSTHVMEVEKCLGIEAARRCGPPDLPACRHTGEHALHPPYCERIRSLRAFSCAYTSKPALSTSITQYHCPRDPRRHEEPWHGHRCTTRCPPCRRHDIPRRGVHPPRSALSYLCSYHRALMFDVFLLYPISAARASLFFAAPLPSQMIPLLLPLHTHFAIVCCHSRLRCLDVE